MSDVKKISGSEQLMTAANIVTMIRIAFIPVLVFIMLAPWVKWLGWDNGPLWQPIIAAMVFVILSVTDTLDGYLARSRNEVTDFGKFMDPLADKFLIIGALLACIPVYPDFELALVISLLIIVFRELAVSSMRLVAKNADGVVIAAAMPGKIKTFSQCVFVMLLLLEEYIFSFAPTFAAARPLSCICLLVMVFFTIYSGVSYFLAYKD